MIKRLFLVLLTALAVAFSSQGSANSLPGTAEQKKEPPQKGKSKPAAPGNAAAMSGCIDEQEGQYVLVDEHGLNRIADLEADGFPMEAFAKHVGHKVTVRGTRNASGARPVFKVRTVETLSDTCAPKPAGQE